MLNYPVSGFVHPFCTSPIYSAIIKLGRGNDPIRNQFSILSLFSNNVQGAWYDPSDMTTLFQDAAGTTPVTTVEQPVGLMLDKSKGLVLGPELVTNGADFVDSNSDGIPDGWNAGGSATISVVNEKLRVLQTTTTSAFAYQAIQCTIGRRYKCSLSFESVNGSTLAISVSTVVGNIDVYVATPGLVTNYTFTFVATATTHYIQLQPWTIATNREAYFDNISVRELPGNHAFQSSSANRPTLSARYNLLTKSEQFDASTVWNRTAAGSTIQGTGVQAVITADYAAGPFSGTLADRVQLNCGTGTTSSDRSGISQLNITTVATQYTAKIYVKPLDSTTNAQLLASNVGILAAGVAATSNDIVDIGSGWKLITRVYPNTVFVQSASEFRIQILGNVSPQTMDLLVWGADLRVSNDALNQPAYQRVNTETDYDTVGFKPYLRFNDPARGMNNWLQTNSINFTYGDKMFVSAGVRKLADNAGLVFEFSQSYGTYDGAFAIQAGVDQGVAIGPYWNFASKGTTGFREAASPASYVAPITSVLSGIGDIGGDKSILRINGAQSAIDAGDQGTDNYGNYPLYIGARAGTSGWFNGRLYQLVVAGKQASAAEITNIETFINQKTGAY